MLLGIGFNFNMESVSLLIHAFGILCVKKRAPALFLARCQIWSVFRWMPKKAFSFFASLFLNRRMCMTASSYVCVSGWLQALAFWAYDGGLALQKRVYMGKFCETKDFKATRAFWVF